MEYAKDVSFNLKCGSKEDVKLHRTNLMSKCILKAKRHKVIISIIRWALIQALISVGAKFTIELNDPRSEPAIPTNIVIVP